MQRTGRLSTPRAQRVQRSRVARVLVIAVVLFLGGALFRLQVLRGADYRLTSKNNRMRELPIPAPRGTIYDQHGRVVAENVPGYQILVMPITTKAGPDTVKMNARIDSLRPILGLTDDQIRAARRKWLRAHHLPMVLLADASPRAVAALSERHHEFPAVLVHQYAKRHYPAGEAIAHFIGYISEISEKELEDTIQFPGYEQGRFIGKTGLEKQYERLLGGTPGKRYLEVDANGGIRRWMPEQEYYTPPVPGKDLHLYLDLDLQQYITEIFPKEYEGAFVAIDPKTGGVLAYYSNPTYDPNKFIGGISGTEYAVLRNDPANPLLDRVVNSGQPAASTWKLAMAGMALDLGVLDPEEYMPQSCGGGITFQGRYAKCHGVHGRNNLIDAIKNSCNVYFYQVGLRIGLRRMLEHGVKLGFDQKTGIDIPHERRPQWPAIDYWEKELGYKAPENEVMSLAIGQGPMTMTIIKLAHIYAALTAPSGMVPAPRLAMESGAPADSITFHTTPKDRWYLEAGMRRVVAPGGTAGRSRLAEWEFIGKTGTAQAPPGKDHGWFVGTGAKAPGEPPEIAVTMFLARSEHGYLASGYVAEAINFYMNRKYGKSYVKFATERMRTAAGLPSDWAKFQKAIVDPPMPGDTTGRN